MNAQQTNELPFSEIPTAPKSYTVGNILARMVDGLGYRFYWASDSLTAQDLAYRPSVTGKTCEETILHIYELSITIKNIANGEVCIRPNPKVDLNYEELRSKTLANLLESRNAFLNKTESEIEALKVIFQNADNRNEFPFWNFINGQLSDAIYHTGQLVVFRRASGNPINGKVNVFLGVNSK